MKIADFGCKFFKVLYFGAKQVAKNKEISFQCSGLLGFMPQIQIGADILNDTNVVNLMINILNLLQFQIVTVRRCNHPGTYIAVRLFFIEFELIYRDLRHWDDDKEQLIENL